MGESFALMAARLILAMVAQADWLHLMPGHPVEPLPLLTLQPHHGVLVTLQPYSASLSGVGWDGGL